ELGGLLLCEGDDALHGPGHAGLLRGNGVLASLSVLPTLCLQKSVPQVADGVACRPPGAPESVAPPRSATASLVCPGSRTCPGASGLYPVGAEACPVSTSISCSAVSRCL